MKLIHISDFSPPSKTRAWISVPHPSLPLVATPSSDKRVNIYSLQNFQLHSTIEKGHTRSVRSVAWKPNIPPETLSLVSGSFDATAGIWRRNEAAARIAALGLETDFTTVGHEADDEEEEEHDWEFSLVLEGHDSEVKSVAFSVTGQYLATCSRDKSVWIWEEIGGEGDDEWETVAVLQDHEGDVKFVSWCPHTAHGDLLASASYDDTVRLWREDNEGEWGCVAVLSGHEGTVWSLDWEPWRNMKIGDEEEDDTPKKPLRLITCSGDTTIRVWRQVLDSESQPRGENSGIPSTMRSGAGAEEWICESILPQVHNRPIYAVSWSKNSGRVVSTGSDSQVVVYEERCTQKDIEKDISATAVINDQDQTELNGHVDETRPMLDGATEWQVVTTLPMAHGPYEINHVTWCPRFDGRRKGSEEMVITTADDGFVKAWALEE